MQYVNQFTPTLLSKIIVNIMQAPLKNIAWSTRARKMSSQARSRGGVALPPKFCYTQKIY